ncbi:PadR family transcriptional regulator [Methanofollis formosanus]|uniref:PadR family transcriptional regulator n=1 Tax=Methanofollis formosanus TaxID=299308 RepID=A0A8G1A2H7_9EURY|nr:PadR family transcriptional regulator [Methanofollis formosanus]QYZ79972.1 PadR family transcriptional regulator [Methanofollis formosanus]
MHDPGLEILTMLATAPCHVYGLKFRLEEEGISRSHSDLYKTVNSLKRRGLVDYEQAPSTKGPAKKVFFITDKGREALFLARKSSVGVVLSDYFRHLALTFQDLMVAEFESERPLRRIAVVPDPLSGGMADLFVAAAADLTGQIPERWLIARDKTIIEKFQSLIADPAAMPCCDGAFDLLIAPGLSEAVPGPLLPELARILAPRGQLVTFLPFTEEMTESSIAGEFLIREVRRFFPELQVWRQTDFLSALSASFDVTSVNHLGFTLIFCRARTRE